MISLASCRHVLAASLALNLLACAPEDVADPSRDLALKQFKPRPGMAGVYVFRDQRLGGLLRMHVEMDDQHLGETRANSYLYREVAPGRHLLQSRSENLNTLEFTAHADTLYFIRQEVRLGMLFGRNRLQRVSEEEGKKAVLALRLLEPVALP